MRNVSLVLIVVVVTMAGASGKKEKIHYDLGNAEAYFADFVKTYNREYKDAEDREVHFRAFVANLEKINKSNEMSETATFGINKFADYTEEERKSMFGARTKQN
ncbi:cysteine proteinase-like [Anticarsia gemmatalis]|uniref:cysteine proteinase-like n=1 Tax=Anticarsia gemmatalis TaxID=129554 RepID=UPI003F77792B